MELDLPACAAPDYDTVSPLRAMMSGLSIFGRLAPAGPHRLDVLAVLLSETTETRPWVATKNLSASACRRLAGWPLLTVGVTFKFHQGRIVTASFAHDANRSTQVTEQTITEEHLAALVELAAGSLQMVAFHMAHVPDMDENWLFQFPDLHCVVFDRYRGPRIRVPAEVAVVYDSVPGKLECVLKQPVPTVYTPGRPYAPVVSTPVRPYAPAVYTPVSPPATPVRWIRGPNLMDAIKFGHSYGF